MWKFHSRPRVNQRFDSWAIRLNEKADAYDVLKVIKCFEFECESKIILNFRNTFRWVSWNRKIEGGIVPYKTNNSKTTRGESSILH